MHGKMKKKVILVMAVMIILSCALISAADYDIKIEIKDDFKQGEKIDFNYTIDFNLQGQVEYIVGIECDNLPSSLLDIRSENTDFEDKIVGKYEGLIVDKKYENCFAYVSIISPIEISGKKSFDVFGVLEFNFKIELNKKVFFKNEKINLDYDSSISAPEITSILTYPSGKERNIKIPSTLQLSEVGTYEINAEASKQGYKTIESSTQFAVIKKQAEIPTGLGIADKGLLSEEKSDIGLIIFSLVLILAVAGIIIVIVYLRRRRINSFKINQKKI